MPSIAEWPFLYAAATGAATGLVNALLTSKGKLRMPVYTQTTREFETGFLGQMIIGAAAALLAASKPSSSPHELVTAAFAAGIGGGAFINQLVRKR